MEGNVHGGGGGGGGSDVAAMHVKTEAVDENPSALVLGSQEPPAPCGDTACRGGGGGGEGTAEELADTELQAATTATPVILYPVSTDRFFTTSGDGKTYLKIAPASVMPPAPSEKTLSSGSDFSSKAVLCLIEAVGRRWGLYETRERSQLFQSVQEEMASKGHVLPVEKIRRKWNNLIVTYKRVKDRSRETGHAKTSWEFFDLMDATLCDTIGTQIINNKRNKGGHAVSTLPSPLTKIAAKPAQLPQPATIIRPNGDFATPGGVEAVGLGPATSQISSTTASTSVNAATVSPTNGPDLKPLIVLNGDIVSTSIHPATIVPAPSFISSPCFTEAASTSPSLGSTSNTDLSTAGYTNCKTPSFSPGVIPFRLSTAPLPHNQNLLSLSSSFPPTPSCLTSSVATSLSAATTAGTEGQSQKGNKEQSSVTLFQEILKQQEEQAYLDRVARRRVEAREKRRERREVRMSESLGRIATALELLSSKQDTVIALLQRLADRK
ncbi:mucin-19 [Stegastes partitus]|uniref:Mucin-19 n=1 Tax=Stegastes partitus TaxID=144197 RepID=A0A9Y4TQP3_9TELE|nr:PREDICTED: mucin-19-like [Stegastes partitus]